MGQLRTISEFVNLNHIISSCSIDSCQSSNGSCTRDQDFPSFLRIHIHCGRMMHSKCFSSNGTSIECARIKVIQLKSRVFQGIYNKKMSIPLTT